MLSDNFNTVPVQFCSRALACPRQRRAAARGLLIGPGVLFSPTQTPSTHFRVAVSLVEDDKGLQVLQSLLGRDDGNSDT